MSISLVLLYYVFLTVSGLEPEEECTTPNNETAKCISLYSCPVLLNAPLSDKATREFVRKSNCGGTAIDPMVCCGSSSTFVKQIDKTNECTTPNNETATCKSLYSCPVLLNAPLSDPKTREFLRQSNCGGTAIEPMVCCGSHSIFVADQKKTMKHESLLPSREICGRQHSDDYFHTVNDTVVTEFPWFASITDGVVPFICTGSLINTRYVLTDAQCLTDPQSNPIIVRLGDYQYYNKTDCIEDSHIYECSDVEDFGIEETIPHPQYVFTYRFHSPHNIGLIRLNRTVSYSDYIRPICLPLPETKRASIGDTVVTTGWGFGRASIKKRTYSELISIEDCKTQFLNFASATNESLCLRLSVIVKNVCDAADNIVMTLGDNELCSSLPPEDGTVLCDLDEGGPVMYSNRLQWHLEGIVSLASFTCSTDVPSVFINVTSYVNWIKESLRP